MTEILKKLYEISEQFAQITRSLIADVIIYLTDIFRLWWPVDRISGYRPIPCLDTLGPHHFLPDVTSADSQSSKLVTRWSAIWHNDITVWSCGVSGFDRSKFAACIREVDIQK